MSVAAAIVAIASVEDSRPPRESSAAITSGMAWPRPPGRHEVGDGPDEQPADDGNQDQPRARQPGEPLVLHDVEEEAVAELHEHREADGSESGAQPHDRGEHHRSATR